MWMQVAIITLLLLLLLVLGVGIYLLREWKRMSKEWRRKQEDEFKQRGSLETLTKGLSNVNERLQRVSGQIEKVGTIGEDVKKFSIDFRAFFTAPKARGDLGEEILKDLIVSILPADNYSFQYSFSNMKRVDAVIKTDKGLIPIDSKFPLDNYRKMVEAENEDLRKEAKKEFENRVKGHIKVISDFYIQPTEGTLDFALMYIPSEAVYYESFVRNPEMLNIAREYKIFPVSPNSFYYFLKTILVGLEGKRIEEKSKQILATLWGLQEDSASLGEMLATLSGHVTHAKATMDKITTQYSRFRGKIETVRSLKETQEKKEGEE